MAEKILLNGVEFHVEKDGDVARITSKENEFVKFMEANGIEKKEVKKVTDAMNEYLRAAVDTAVDKAGIELSADADIKFAEVTLPFGLNKSDNIEVHVTREKEVRIPTTGETVVKPAIKVAVNTKATRISKAHIKELREELEDVLARGC
jgi:nucleoid DNA-binding protein